MFRTRREEDEREIEQMLDAGVARRGRSGHEADCIAAMTPEEYADLVDSGGTQVPPDHANVNEAFRATWEGSTQ